MNELSKLGEILYKHFNEARKMDMIRVTGLWKQTDKSGHTFLSGNLNPISSVMVMPNTFKKDGKEPDYFLYFKQNEKKEAGKEEKQTDL